MSAKVSGRATAACRLKGWAPLVRLGGRLGLVEPSRLVWLPVIALAVVCRAPAECYATIVTVMSAMSAPGTGERHD